MVSYAAVLRPHADTGRIIKMYDDQHHYEPRTYKIRGSPPRILPWGLSEKENGVFHVEVNAEVVVSVLSGVFLSSVAFPTPLSNICYVAVV